MTLESAFVLLFLVIDPFGNVPFFVAALNQVEPSRHRWVIWRELLVAYAVMVAFLFAGRPLLTSMGAFSQSEGAFDDRRFLRRSSFEYARQVVGNAGRMASRGHSGFGRTHT